MSHLLKSAAQLLPLVAIRGMTGVPVHCVVYLCCVYHQSLVLGHRAEVKSIILAAGEALNLIIISKMEKWQISTLLPTHFYSFIPQTLSYI